MCGDFHAQHRHGDQVFGGETVASARIITASEAIEARSAEEDASVGPSPEILREYLGGWVEFSLVSIISEIRENVGEDPVAGVIPVASLA